MKKIVLGLSILLMCTEVKAETLIDAFVQSYQNNPSLKSERAKLRAIDETYSQASSGWRPTVDVVGDVSYLDTDLELDDKKLSDGSRVPYSASVVLNQSLFSGFDTVASQMSAENTIKAGRYALKSAEQQLLLDTVNAYMGVVYAEAVLNLNKNRAQVYAKHVEEAKQRYEIGEITITDYSQSDARYEGAKADIVKAEGDLKNAKTYYETVTGVAPNNLEINPSYPVVLIASTFEDAFNAAMAENPSIKSALFQEKSARNEVARVGSGLLPRLDAQAKATYGKNQQYDEDKYSELKATATLTIPLYEAGLSYSRVRQAKETANQKRLDIESIRLQVKNGVYESWETIQAIKARLGAYKAQIKAYEIALESYKKELEVGTKTVIDVMDAEQELLDAKLSEIQAKRDEVIESFKLIALTGGLVIENFDSEIAVYNPVQNYEKVKNKWGGTDIKD